MGSYLDQVDRLRDEYVKELNTLEEDIVEFTRAIELKRAAAADLEEAIKRLTPLTTIPEGITPVIDLRAPKDKPQVTRHVDSYVTKRRTRSDWLALIRREFPDRAFTSQELASAVGVSQNTAYDALGRLFEDGYVNRRGGKNWPGQHEVEWGIRDRVTGTSVFDLTPGALIAVRGEDDRTGE